MNDSKAGEQSGAPLIRGRERGAPNVTLRAALPGAAAVGASLDGISF